MQYVFRTAHIDKHYNASVQVAVSPLTISARQAQQAGELSWKP
jgi:hypothetical protein